MSPDFRRVVIGFLPVLATVACVAQSPIAAPGFRPRPHGSHALVGARVIPRPGAEWANATIVIRDGRIVASGPDVRPPADARIWDLTGLTVYPGFIDSYVVQGTNAAPPPSFGPPPVGDGSGALASGVGSDPRFLGVPGQELDPGTPGPGAGIPDVTPERRMDDGYTPAPKLNEAMRELGFTVANLVPGRGIIRGQSAAVALGDSGPNESVLVPSVSQCVSFSPDPGFESYPNSLMGAIAVIRQAWFDARWYPGARDSAALPRTFNRSLAALQPTLQGENRQSVTVDPGSVLMAARAVEMGRELGWRMQVVASGQEWRRTDLLRGAAVPFIVPVSFPAAPKLTEDGDWEALPLDLLRQWDWAPENPAALRRVGLEIALTTHGLGQAERKSFRRQLKRAIDRGLSELDALAALTTVPARLCGLSDQLGVIESGRLAHLTVVAGSYFDPASSVRAVWVDGVPFELAPPKPVVAKTNAPPKTPEAEKQRIARLPWDDGRALTNPPAVLVRNAVIWTSGPRGTLTNASMLVRGGRIESVGAEPAALPEGTLVIDAAGRHVTPGLIDCHSHSMILGAVNEMSLPSTAMVRIADVVNSESETIHQQLAGGLTIANLLHGSANPIGGQNCVIKLRAGAGPDGLVFTNAPAGIKFALGENPKQSSRSERGPARFPQTRMGVGTFYVNRFTAARQYAEAWSAYEAGGRKGAAPRRDLELEAIAEILAGTRLIHCHSYRQDEILAFLRTMEGFGVRVATLQHILEGYKVADEIAKHGAGASAFADWWAYKYEVIDAIPHAGSLMNERGVVVSFNSDSSDHARRLNFEAAKAVKYGGTSEADALRFVTLNPAKQLRIDGRVGSLEPGKDGDFVVWSGHPLDSSSRCDQTWIEGIQYFDRDREPALVAARSAEHAALLAKLRKGPPKPEGGGGGGDAPSDAARALFFQRALEQARTFGVKECQDCVLEDRH